MKELYLQIVHPWVKREKNLFELIHQPPLVRTRHRDANCAVLPGCLGVFAELNLVQRGMTGRTYY